MTVLKVHQLKQEESDQRQEPLSKALMFTSRYPVQNKIQALQLLAKNKYYQNIQTYLKVSADFPVHHTTYKLM